MIGSPSPFPSPFPTTPIPLTNNTPVQQEVQSMPTTKSQNRYVNFNASSGDGCYFYRRGFLSNFIRMSNYGDVADLTKMITQDGFYSDTTSITVQRQASSHQKDFILYLKSIQSRFNFKLIYEIDDVVFREEIPDYNVSKFAFDSDEIRQNCVDMINMVDEVTVTCQYMKDLYIEKTGQEKITVVPNFMPYWWIGHQYDYKKIINNFDSHKRKPRIVYSGSGAHFDVKNKNNHQDDLSHIIKFIIDNRKKYQFIFIGAYPPPLNPYILTKEIEFHPWKSLLEYPTFLSKLDVQLFLAPLMDIPFNRSKSDIKFVEACQLGIPCLCQDMETYKHAPDFMKFKDADDLTDRVDFMLNWKNRSKYYKLIPELRKIGESRFLELEPNVGSFLEALNTPFGSPERKFLRQWN